MRTLKGRRGVRDIGPQIILVIFTILALFPIYMILTNSFKLKKFIFGAPFGVPIGKAFSLIGYQTVLSRSHVMMNFANSLIVTVASLFLIRSAATPP